jgi:hypothetical protein
LETAAQKGITQMATPTVGEMRFAQTILKTERMARRRPLNPMWRSMFEGAVVVTFVFFLFM